MTKRFFEFAVVLMTVSALGRMADAEVLDRPLGIKVGERLTICPSVSMSLTYDSNVEANSGTGSGKKDDFLWTISPILALRYNAETWSANLSGFYNYRQYFDSSHQNYNHHNYGEEFRWNWSNSTGTEKGWSLILGESFQQITMADDMVLDGGQNYSGDSRQLQIAGAVQRRFNQYWHGDVNASYYWLDYDNDETSRYAYYGWDRILVGAEAGFAPSPWTDILVAGSYQYYNQDNAEGSSYGISDSSQGVSLQGGLGSYMTERISYRLLAGWSMFDYGKGASKANGFVYTASGNWKIGETWNTMLLASSYYQPSERQYSSQSRVDEVSWGIAKVMVRGKLRATFDVRYRHETNESAEDSDWDYSLDIWTGRLGADYTFCRFLSVFAYGEYQNSMNSEADKRNGAYDYDRWRVTAGFRVQY